MASPKIYTSELDLDARTLTFNFAHGETLVATLEDVKPVLTQVALHGLKQKLADSFANNDGPEEAHNKASELYSRLKAGDWTYRRPAGEASHTLTVEAISRLKSLDPAAVKATWDELPDDTKSSIKKDPEVKAMIATIKAERAQKRAEKSDAPSALDAFAA